MRQRARLAVGTICAALTLTTVGCSNGSPEPGPTSSAPDGGSAECSADLITEAVRQDFDTNYPGSTFVSLDGFRCEGGWATAKAQFEASGSTFPTVVLLRAQDGSWTAVTIEPACRPAQAESGIPASIYAEVCGSD
jgi:hypothetical protein